MHAEAVKIDIEEVLRTEPIRPRVFTSKVMWAVLAVCSLVLTIGLFVDPAHTWSVYYVNAFFWLGLSMGGIMLSVIFQIVRAVWCTPIRRICEANVAFLPYAYLLFVCSYFGREYLFPWATAPMPGREWWMQPDFAYARNMLLLGILVFALRRFVRMSLRSDVGFAQERAQNKSCWAGWPYSWLSEDWKGSDVEILTLQRKMSWNAPLIVLLYAVIVSLISFEMVMGMDTIWFSNMYGGFVFLGNIYMALAMTIALTVYFTSISPAYSRCVSTQQLWDLGKLTFGFCMLWGYTMFAQYLPQWYGNLPEETQWLILRVHEYPWKPLAWVAFSMCFVTPFILFSGEDIKKTPPAAATVAMIVVLGVWLERYVTIVPSVSPDVVPFGAVEVAVFLAFGAGYFLSVSDFMSRFPFVPVSHPQTRGSTDW